MNPNTWAHEQRIKNLEAATAVRSSGGGSFVNRISGTGPSISVAGDVTSILLTGATSLTDLTGGIDGQIVEITIQSAGTAVTRAGSAGTKFLLSGSQNCVAADAYATLTVVHEAGAGGWVEMSRSTANG